MCNKTNMNSFKNWPSLLGLQNTAILSLQRGKSPRKVCPRYATKQSDDEASGMLELCGMWSPPSLPGPLRPVVVPTDRPLSMAQIELFDIWTVLDWIIKRRTVFTFNCA